MKRIIAILLVLVMVFTATACSSSDKSGNDREKNETTKPLKPTDIVIVDRPEDTKKDIDPSSVVGEWQDEFWDYQLYIYDDGTYSAYMSGDRPDDGTKSEEGTISIKGSKVFFNMYDSEYESDFFSYLTYDPTSDQLLSDDGPYLFRSGRADPPEPDDDPVVDPDDEPDPTDEPEFSPDTVGYFNYYDIYPNAEIGNRIHFENGGAYASVEGKKYYITSPDVQLDITDFSGDDGYGYGHITFVITHYFPNDIPADFGRSYISDYWDIYDTFSGDLISPDTSVSNDDNYYTSSMIQARPGGSYEIQVSQKFEHYKSTENIQVLSSTITIIFTTGYYGVDLVVFTAPKNRNEYNEYRKAPFSRDKLLERDFLTLDDALIFEIF